jgi:hypothetical protein
MKNENNTEWNLEIAKLLGWHYVTWQEAKEKEIRAGWYSRLHNSRNQKPICRSHKDLDFSSWENIMYAFELISKKIPGFQFHVKNTYTHCIVLFREKPTDPFFKKKISVMTHEIPLVNKTSRLLAYECLYKFAKQYQLAKLENELLNNIKMKTKNNESN